MGKPIRILEVVNVMDRAGLETMLMNHYRHLDREAVQLDFLAHRPVAGAYDEEIRSLGGNVYRAPRLYPQNCLAYRRFMRAFFAEHGYPVVHSHIDAMSAFPLAAARSCGVAARVAHSHNDSVDRDLKYPIKQAARRRLPGIATHYWACSEAAGAFLFGEENRDRLHIVKNAIDLEAFRFDAPARESARAELGLRSGELVVGHVGRFCAVKNHSFLVDLLGQLRRDGVDAVLALVGDGELRERVERKAASLGLSGSVRFLGLREDVPRLMQAFDVLAFPSLHEGIPLALVEAQAAGLPVLASDRVSPESLVVPNAAALPLESPLAIWAAKARLLAAAGRFQNPMPLLAGAGYEIASSARSLQDAYLTLYEEAVSR